MGIRVDRNFDRVIGSEKFIEYDTLLLSVGLIPENELTREAGAKISEMGGPIVDNILETTLNGVFACGNVLQIHDLVNLVTAEAKRAGLNAVEYIKNRYGRDIQLNFDGLEKFKDLFLIITNDKKSKLKGFLSFYMNMLQISKTLRIFSDKFIKVFSGLENERHEPKWYEPRYFFNEGQEKERNDYLEKIYLDYGLTQKNTYLLYVEGSTEKILLEDWLDLVYSRTKVKVDVKRIYGKKDYIFKYLTKEFDAKEHFLVLDADKPGYASSKKNELVGRKIPKDSFYIFIPDFITANFEPIEILEALKGYFHEIKNKIYEAIDQKKSISEEEYQDFKRLLENKEEFDRYEDLVEEFLAKKLENPRFKLKKTEFAHNLLTVMRNNLSLFNRSRKYPFEEVLGKFVSKIQKKKYPGLNINS